MRIWSPLYRMERYHHVPYDRDGENLKKGWRAKEAILRDECVTAQSTILNREEGLPQQQGG